MLNIVKLSVGSETIADLQAWQDSAAARGSDGLPRHVTRMWPRRQDEVLAGGSIYWVIARLIQCRQRILRFDEVIGSDGIRRCAFVLEQELLQTRPTPKRPFQGWRYLKDTETPADLKTSAETGPELPPHLAKELADIGVI